MPQQKGGPAPGEVFADGIGWIGVHGGVVRMEFFSFDAPLQDGRTDKEPERTVRQRVVMPIDGFLRGFAAMGDLVKKLEESGLVVRRAGAAAPTIAPAAAAGTARAPAESGPQGKGPTASSPNFG